MAAIAFVLAIVAKLVWARAPERAKSSTHLAAGAAALPIISRVAWTQAYPSRPVIQTVFRSTPNFIAVSRDLSCLFGTSLTPLSPWSVKFTSMIYVGIEISRCLDCEHYYNLGRTI
jgi:hypothetical protein